MKDPHAKHKATTDMLKFMARYPFSELVSKNDPHDCVQIVMIHYAGQHVLLRDFCDYTVDDIIRLFKFRDSRINKLWNKKIINYQNLINDENPRN